MAEDKALTVRETAPVELEVSDVKKQVEKIQEIMAAVMKNGHHYGAIPGTDGKKTLLKPGAEKLGLTFRLAPFFEITRSDLADDHREYEVVCTLKHQITENVVGQGVGSCTTREKKYRWRQAKRKCPECGIEAIIKGKEEYGGGWVCYKKKKGCGAMFEDLDPRIMSQEMGMVENPDIADLYNVVLKMAKKRAHVDAMITACAASDIFAQDIDDPEDEGLGQKGKNGNLNGHSNGQTNGGPPSDQLEPERRKLYPKLQAFNERQRQFLGAGVNRATTREGLEVIGRMIDILSNPVFVDADINQALTVLANSKNIPDLKMIVEDFEKKLDVRISELDEMANKGFEAEGNEI